MIESNGNGAPVRASSPAPAPDTAVPPATAALMALSPNTPVVPEEDREPLFTVDRLVTLLPKTAVEHVTQKTLVFDICPE